MKLDTVVAGGLFAVISAKLLQKRLYSMIAIFAVLIFVIKSMLQTPNTISVALAIIGMYLVCLVTQQSWEGFENEEEEDTKNPSPAPPKTSDPHVTPEQIGGMRRDTRELLDLQKELMGSLSEMKPAIEQGAELLKTFSTFFGDSGGQPPM